MAARKPEQQTSAQWGIAAGKLLEEARQLAGRGQQAKLDGFEGTDSITVVVVVSPDGTGDEVSFFAGNRIAELVYEGGQLHDTYRRA